MLPQGRVHLEHKVMKMGALQFELLRRGAGKHIHQHRFPHPHPPIHVQPMYGGRGRLPLGFSGRQESGPPRWFFNSGGRPASSVHQGESAAAASRTGGVRGDEVLVQTLELKDCGFLAGVAAKTLLETAFAEDGEWAGSGCCSLLHEGIVCGGTEGGLTPKAGVVLRAALSLWLGQRSGCAAAWSVVVTERCQRTNPAHRRKQSWERMGSAMAHSSRRQRPPRRQRAEVYVNISPFSSLESNTIGGVDLQFYRCDYWGAMRFTQFYTENGQQLIFEPLIPSCVPICPTLPSPQLSNYSKIGT